MDGRELLEGIGKPISPLVLGTAHFSAGEAKPWYGVMDRFVDLGGTAIDTAHNYGESESTIGAWLSERGTREEVVLCTKGAHGEGILPADHFEQAIGEELATSLERLQTEYVDLYWLHRDNPAVPVEPILACLNEHLKAGRIRAFGASNWAYARVKEARACAETRGTAGFAAVSNNLSLAEQAEPFYAGLVSVDDAGAQWHIETGTPLFSWSSQARGFFTGRFSPAMQDSSDAFERRMAQVYCTPENLERRRRAEDLGERKGGYTATEVALAWVLHRPHTTVPVVGPRTPDEMDSCARALSLELSEEESRGLARG